MRKLKEIQIELEKAQRESLLSYAEMLSLILNQVKDGTKTLNLKRNLTSSQGYESNSNRTR